MTPWALPPTLHEACSFSNAAASSSRERRTVPRDSMLAVAAPIVSLPNSDFSSPEWSASSTTTLPPRVALDRNAVRMPAGPGTPAMVVRRTMFSTDASKSSPAATASPPLKPFITAATSTFAGAGARTGVALGMNVPRVRLLDTKYCEATRFTSASVAALMRSRRSKPSRQSPVAMYSESARPTRCGSFSVCVKPRSQMFLAAAPQGGIPTNSSCAAIKRSMGDLTHAADCTSGNCGRRMGRKDQ